MVPLWVRSSSERPVNAYVAIENRGYWYFIPHSDHISKQAFGLLIYLFRLQSPTSQTTAPVLTIPTGP